MRVISRRAVTVRIVVTVVIVTMCICMRMIIMPVRIMRRGPDFSGSLARFRPP